MAWGLSVRWSKVGIAPLLCPAAVAGLSASAAWQVSLRSPEWAGRRHGAVKVPRMAARLVVLVSGAGTNLQALLDACADGSYGAAVVAVGADRTGIEGLARAQRAGVPAFTHQLSDHPDRAAWDRALAESCARHQPDLVISAGFMQLVGQDLLGRFAVRLVMLHPSLLP